MSTLTIHGSGSPQALLSKACELLRGPASGGNPLLMRWVVQPSRLWEQTLRQRLADGGIAAGLTFGSLRLTLERAFRLLCPERPLMDEDQLFWALLGLLDTHQDRLDQIGLNPDTAPAKWLARKSRDPSTGRLQLARLLCTILDDHATHRPREMLEWLGNGPASAEGDAPWIATLAQRLWRESRNPRPLALRLSEFQKALLKATSAPAAFPEQVTAVLTGAQPTAYLESLGAMARHCPIHLLVLETCERGLSDQVATWRAVRTKWKARAKQQSFPAFLAEQKWLVSGSLQSFWGGAGIALQQQLVDLEEHLAHFGIQVEEDSLPSPRSTRETALGVLQQDILVAHQPRKESERSNATPHESLRLLNASSPLRELEGARDAIRWALQNDPHLKPSDILMVLTDTARYAPLLPSVFGSHARDKAASTHPGPDGLPRIPWQLADRSLRTDSDAMAALLQIISAFGDRITLPILADLLAQPAIQARLGFSQQETVELVGCLHSARFRWGLTQEDRAQDDQPGQDDGLWTLDFALRRLAAGFVFPDDTLDPVGGPQGVTPLPAFEGLATAQLARFILWAQELEAARAGFKKDRPLGDANLAPETWLGWLHQCLPKLIATDGEREGQSVWISRITGRLAEGSGKLAPGAVFSARAFEILLGEAVTAFQESLPIGGGMGGMTIASPRMARALPAKVLVVVGLCDGAWPHQDLMRPRGLLVKPRPGDRMRREEDRLSTLEWVLSAEDLLVWTWTGRNEHKGKEIPASVVVGELLDACSSTFTSRDFIQTLKMHAFHPKHFAPDNALRSFDQVAALAAREIYESGGKETPALSWTALPLKTDLWNIPSLMDFACTGTTPDAWTDDTWISLASHLVKFWKMPCRGFLKVVGVDTEDEQEILPEREDLDLDGLAQWQLRNLLIKNLLGPPAPIGSDAATTQDDRNAALKRRMQRAGQLPPGKAGDESFADCCAEAQEIVDNALQRKSAKGCISLLSEMCWEPAESMVRANAGSVKPKHLLQARIEQCAFIARHDAPCVVWVVGRKSKKGGTPLPVLNQEAALQQLQQLTALALLGSSIPLPFFPETSAKRAEGKADASTCAELFWEGSNFQDAEQPESENPAVRLAYRGLDPLEMGLPPTPAQDAAAWNRLLEIAGLSSGAPLFEQLSKTVYAFLEDIKREEQKAKAEKEAGKASGKKGRAP